MRLMSVGIMSGALAIGLAGSAAAYRAASVDPPDHGASVVSTGHEEPDRAQPARPGARFRWAPCTPPARLERGVCVTDVTRTVVVPAPAPAATPAAPAAPSAPAAAPEDTPPGTEPAEPEADDAGEHAEHVGEDDGEHEADD